jgi:hypothetical protein
VLTPTLRRASVLRRMQEDDRADAAAAERSITVLCPPGVEAGELVEVEAGAGRTELVAIPLGVRPGDEFEHHLSVGGSQAEQQEEREARVVAPAASELQGVHSRRRYSVALAPGALENFLAVVDVPEAAEGSGSDDGESSDVLRVLCPDGVTAGDALFVQTPDGTEVTTEVPEGIGPGMEFTVDLLTLVGAISDVLEIEGDGGDEEEQEQEEDEAEQEDEDEDEEDDEGLVALLDAIPGESDEDEAAAVAAVKEVEAAASASDDEEREARVVAPAASQPEQEMERMVEPAVVADEQASVVSSPAPATPFAQQQQTRGPEQLGLPPDSLAPMRELMAARAFTATPRADPDQSPDTVEDISRNSDDVLDNRPASPDIPRPTVITQASLTRLMQPTRENVESSPSSPPSGRGKGVLTQASLARLTQPARRLRAEAVQTSAKGRVEDVIAQQDFVSRLAKPAGSSTPREVEPVRKHVHQADSESYQRLTNTKSYTGMYATRFDAEGRGMGLKNRDADTQLDLSQVTRPQLNPAAPAAPKRVSRPRKRGRGKSKQSDDSRRAKVLVKTTVRAGVERHSKKVGTLARGAEVLVLEQALTSDGQPRVRIPTGWVSIVAMSGQPVLQLMRPIHQKLSDSKLYTGTSRFHFDPSGKGKGLAGRPRENWNERDFVEQCAPVGLESTLRHTWRGPHHNSTSSYSAGRSAYYQAPAGTILRTPTPASMAPRRDEVPPDPNEAAVVADDMLTEQSPSTTSAATVEEAFVGHEEEQMNNVMISTVNKDADASQNQASAILAHAKAEPPTLAEPPAEPPQPASEQTPQPTAAEPNVANAAKPPIESEQPMHTRPDLVDVPPTGLADFFEDAIGSDDHADDASHSQDEDEAESGDNRAAMEVVVPEGSQPGDTLTLELPDGSQAEILIPDGCHPGDAFDVEIQMHDDDDSNDVRSEATAADDAQAESPVASGSTSTAADQPSHDDALAGIAGAPLNTGASLDDSHGAVDTVSDSGGSETEGVDGSGPQQTLFGDSAFDDLASLLAVDTSSDSGDSDTEGVDGSGPQQTLFGDSAFDDLASLLTPSQD